MVYKFIDRKMVLSNVSISRALKIVENLKTYSFNPKRDKNKAEIFRIAGEERSCD